MSFIYKAKLTLGCHYYSDRADALTDDAFKRFFADNPAYQVKQYLLIDNDNLRQKRKARKPLNRIATSHHNRVCQVWQTLLFCPGKRLKMCVLPVFECYHKKVENISRTTQ